jgi:hypothetical protein
MHNRLNYNEYNKNTAQCINVILLPIGKIYLDIYTF